MAKVTKIGNAATITIDTTLLEAMLKGIDLKLVAKVGILGSHGARKSSEGVTNADIGLAHEKGVKSRNLPRRSWLEEPLQDHLKDHYIKLGKKAIVGLLNSNYVQAYAELGLVCEVIIQKGFETGGYGKWKELKASTIRRKGSSAILIDTAQLRKAITSEVVAK